MTHSRILAAARLAASEPMRDGLHEAAADAAYELLAACRGIGQDAELQPRDQAHVHAVADEAAVAGLHAAAAAMLAVLLRSRALLEADR